jgi:hypothetical protein
LNYFPRVLSFSTHHQSRRNEYLLAAAAARAENLDNGFGTMGRFDDNGIAEDDDNDGSSQYACECRVSFLEIHNEEVRVSKQPVTYFTITASVINSECLFISSPQYSGGSRQTRFVIGVLYQP